MTGSWVLNTASSTYAVSLALDDTVLVLDYFGPLADPVPVWERPTSPPVMSTLTDYAPVEYAALGTRNVHGSELIVEYDDGSRGSRFHYADHRFDVTETDTRLAVRFVDDRGLELTQNVLTRVGSEVIERWVSLRDVRASGAPIRVVRAFSGALCVQAPYGSRIEYLAGAWMREMQPKAVDLDLGTLRIGSRQGITGHLFAPTMSITPLGADHAVDPGAGTVGVALAWSGSWAMAAEAHPTGLLRVSAGLDDEGTALVLTPGRQVETPRILLACASGPDELARVWHRYQRGFLTRSMSAEHRPVVYNSWEATEFDVRAVHQLELAGLAAELGVEVFVLDAGWSAGMVDGNSGRGDWTTDLDKFPGGLAPFAEQIASRGMGLGIWIEPEAVNANSDLYRQHPEWVYHNEGIPQELFFDQYVLDIGQPEVFVWLQETLRRLLTDQPITFLKWDMTRPLTSPGRVGDPFAFEWSFAHANAYYRLLEMIRREFPHVTVEGCAGGGGRVDNAVLGLVDVVWASDATGPRDRLLIQDGFLRAYAPHVMSSWVTDTPGNLDRAPTSLPFRFVVAMAGVLGIGADVTKWSAADRSVAKEMIELYKELRPILHNGEVYRHSTPNAAGYAIEYSGGSDHGGRIVVLTYDGSRERTGPEPVSPLSIRPTFRIRLSSPDPSATYRLRADGSIHSGAALRSAGLVVPWAVAVDADVLVLDPVHP